MQFQQRGGDGREGGWMSFVVFVVHLNHVPENGSGGSLLPALYVQ